MKPPLVILFLCAVGCLFQGSAAEPTAADLKRFQETKAKAEKGDAAAQYGLGFMYLNGRGVAKDEVVAYKWFLLSRVQGDENAERYIQIIEGGLTPSQRAEGQRWSREWKPLGTKP